MKRFTTLLIVLALLLSASALAFRGEGYPGWDGAVTPSSGLCGTFDGEGITLSFDPSGEFSNLADGLVQACFFAYDASNENYLELYLLIPADLQPGDVLASGDGQDCSIYLYETVAGSETFYYAGNLGDSFAAASSFEIDIDQAESVGAAIHMRGRLQAQMIRYDGADSNEAARLRIDGALFDFSLPLSENTFSPSPSQEADPDAPSPTIPILPNTTFPAIPEKPGAQSGAPAFTLPPDYISI